MTLGRVVKSRHARYAEGDSVTGILDTQAYAVSNGAFIRNVALDIAPASAWLGSLGDPGMTAYCALMDGGYLEESATVAISAATTSIGAMAGQIARSFGCRIVGLVDDESECRYAVETLGFDAAIDRTAPDLDERMHALCPEKPDVYFDLVGGETLAAVMRHAKPKGRIILCNTQCIYDAENFATISNKQLRLQSFFISHHLWRYPEAIGTLLAWHHSGRVVFRDRVSKAKLSEISTIFSRAPEDKQLQDTIFDIT